jgi:PmbA protein
MDMAAFRDKAFSAARSAGFESWEIYSLKGAEFSVRALGQRIDEYKNSYPAGISFRGVINGKMGYASTEKLDEALIGQLVERAAENAQLIESDDPALLFAGSPEYPVCDAWSDELEKISVKEKIELALELERLTLAEDPRIAAAEHCTVGNGWTEVMIANSKGLNLTKRSNLFYACVMARATENGVTKTGLKIWHGRDMSKLSLSDIAKEAVSKAVRSLHAASVPTGELPVVFEPEAACSFISCFLPVFFAEMAQKGFSLLKGKVGQRIASDAVTINDDGVAELSCGSVPFDSEGVACLSKTVVSNGVFKTFLHNLKTASKDGVESTGNGFKRSYAGTVETAAQNFYIKASNKPIEESFAGLGKVLSVSSLMGLHSGANPVTGDFSLLVAEGTLIDDDSRKPVEQVAIAGNFFSLLKDVLAVGNDLEFSLPDALGSIGMPSILVKSLKISGEVL